MARLTILSVAAPLFLMTACSPKTVSDFDEYLELIQASNNMLKYMEGRKPNPWDEAAASEVASRLAPVLSTLRYVTASMMWDATGVPDRTNGAIMKKIYSEVISVQGSIRKLCSHFHYAYFRNVTLQRLFLQILLAHPATLPEKEGLEEDALYSSMRSIYCSASIQTENGQMSQLYPHLADVMSKSGDEASLKNTWIRWHRQATRPQRKLFINYTTLLDKKAKLSGFSSLKDAWLSSYETERIDLSFKQLWKEIRYLYMLLHAFVRKELGELYGKKHFDGRNIPAHLLGDMFGQNWKHLYPHLAKKYEFPTFHAKWKKKVSSSVVFQEAEQFFISLGLQRLPASFWQRSILKEGSTNDMMCQPMSLFVSSHQDIRIHMAVFNERESDVSHMLGHVYYFMQLSKLHPAFQREANEDISSPIPFLLRTSLETLPLLPFAYSLDLWRWRLSQGHIPLKVMNKGYWSLRYFVSTVMQFQIYEQLCVMCGYRITQYDFYKCNLRSCHKAGDAIRKALQLGTSTHWKEPFHILTGSSHLSVSSMIKYFGPLKKWLEERTKGESLGWSQLYR